MISVDVTGNDDDNEINRERDREREREREYDVDKDAADRRFPSLEQQVTSLEDDQGSPGGPVITVQDIIFRR